MATKGIGRPLTIMLRADTDQFSKGIATAEGKLKSLNKSVGKASAVAAAALGGLAVAGMDFAKLAAEDEKSARNLALTLQNVTGATKAQTAAVEDYISQTSLALGIQDDKLRPAFSRLVRSTEDVTKAQELLNLALDISASTGKPLQDVANGLGKAFDGNAASLGRLGLGLDESILKSKDFGIIYAALMDKFKGSAKNEAATAEGSFNRLTVAIDEAKESIGYGLLPFVKTAADKLAEFAPKIKENADEILKWSIVIAGTAAGIIALNTAITLTIAAMGIANTVYGVLRTTTIFLAAATGNLAAKQALAEATYRGSKIAVGLYTIALGINTTAVKLAEIGVKNLTIALLSNPFTAVAVAIGAVVYGMYRLAESTEQNTETVTKAAPAIRGYRTQMTRLKDTVNDTTVSIVKATAATSNLAQESRDVARAAGRSASKFVSWKDILASYNLDAASATSATSKLTKGQTALEKATEKAQKIADKYNKRLQTARDRLVAAKQAFKDYSDTVRTAITSEFSFASAFEEKGEGGFLASLQKQADKARAFAGKIGELVKLGLSQASLDQILAAGPTVGSAIADELLAGGSAAVSQVNSLVASVNSVAKTIAKSTAAAFFQAGITQGEAIVKGIIQAAKDAGFIIKDGTITLPTQPDKIEDIVKNNKKSSKSFSQNQAQAQSNSYNIVINGAIDPEGVRRSLEKVFQQSSRRTGPVNFVGATL
jgi:hypothetical protein